MKAFKAEVRTLVAQVPKPPRISSVTISDDIGIFQSNPKVNEELMEATSAFSTLKETHSSALSELNQTKQHQLRQ